MQVKIVIGTVAFMLTMMILGFAVLREPARLAQYTVAAKGRSIEAGAHIFENNCATCHGIDGDAKECYNSAGEQVGCQGLPLNDYDMLCGDPTYRMDTLNWAGTKEDFVKTTIAAGRFGTVMPVWSEEFGGPMRPDQIQNVADFVLNWESEELCANEPVRYSWPEAVADYLASDDGAAGDAANGAELYVTYGCSGCHGDTAVEGSNAVGPWLGDIANVGATRVDGLDAAGYVYHSILDPNAFISPDCPTGPCATPSAMPATFAARIGSNPTDMADLLAFLLGN
ncbi:MAG: c-type cytochrome [Anaerolineales bacterium]|nr:c-type cytochrome [Anaerolineales bacterium]